MTLRSISHKINRHHLGRYLDFKVGHIKDVHVYPGPVDDKGTVVKYDFSHSSQPILIFSFVLYFLLYPACARSARAR